MKKTKICKDCRCRKPLESGFYVHPAMEDGYLNKCKVCVRSRVKKHRAANDSVREYDMQRFRDNPRRREYAAQNTRKFRQQHPGKYKAQTAVSNAVRDGRLERKPCEVCGVTKVHAHHDDYRKPLVVRWLCPLHHHRHHAK